MDRHFIYDIIKQTTGQSRQALIDKVKQYYPNAKISDKQIRIQGQVSVYFNGSQIDIKDFRRSNNVSQKSRNTRRK